MQDLKRVTSITKLYPRLRGLRAIPWGIYILFSATDTGARLPNTNFLMSLLPIFIAWILEWPIGRYYERAFGKVQPTPDQQYYEKIGSVILMVAIPVASSVDATANPPISLLLLIPTIIYLSNGLTSHHARYYLGAALLCACASILPLLLSMPVSELYFTGPYSRASMVALGSLMIILGLFDHLLLIRALKPLPQGSDEQASI